MLSFYVLRVSFYKNKRKIMTRWCLYVARWCLYQQNWNWIRISSFYIRGFYVFAFLNSILFLANLFQNMIILRTLCLCEKIESRKKKNDNNNNIEVCYGKTCLCVCGVCVYCWCAAIKYLAIIIFICLTAKNYSGCNVVRFSMPVQCVCNSSRREMIHFLRHEQNHKQQQKIHIIVFVLQINSRMI